MARERSERKYPRKPIRRAYVEFSRPGTRLSRMFHPEVLRGPVVDISRSGVQFRTTQALDEGECLYMTLRFPDLAEAVKLRAEVRWIREDKKVGIENYTHIVGAEYVEFTPHAWDLIALAVKE